MSILKAVNIYLSENSYGFQKVKKYEKRNNYLGVNIEYIGNDDKELQKKFLSYLCEFESIQKTVFMIEPFPRDHHELTKFKIDGKEVALQVKDDVIINFFNELTNKKKLDANKRKYEIENEYHAETKEMSDILEQKNNKIKELEKSIEKIQNQYNELKEQTQKSRAEGVHKTYTTICCLLIENIFSNENILKKEDFFKKLEEKMQEMYPEELPTKQCFERFWKILPKKFKYAPGKPSDKG